MLQLHVVCFRERERDVNCVCVCEHFTQALNPNLHRTRTVVDVLRVQGLRLLRHLLHSPWQEVVSGLQRERGREGERESERERAKERKRASERARRFLSNARIEVTHTHTHTHTHTKHNGQLSFLHVYHHLTIFMFYWINCNIGYDGDM
jgi:hypothetical protein